jgi:hypothetical protein
VDNSHLKVYQKGGAPAGAAGTDAALPEPGDDYKAAGREDSHEIPGLVVIVADAAGGMSHFSFEYRHIVNLELGFPPAGGVAFTFLYSGLRPKLVIAKGDLLLRTWQLIGLGRVPWIRQARRDFRPAGTSKEPVIASIQVIDWVRPRPQAEELLKTTEALEELLEDA